MWFQVGKKPGPLPDVIYTNDNLAITNAGIYPEEQLNEWGWFKCPAIENYDTFYYVHEWSETDWAYIVQDFSTREQKIEAKKNQYINLLRTWYREARYEVLLQTEGSSLPEALTSYLHELQKEVSRLSSIQYKDANIDKKLQEITSNKTLSPWPSKALGEEEDLKTLDTNLNQVALDFWYNYNNNSMPVKQRGGFGLIG